ncbi:type IV secretory system conjugative DNA transfer family protein [Geodermatophilus sp. SYSU D01180]
MTAGTGVLAVGSAATVDFPVFRAAATAGAALLDLPVPARWTWTVQAGGGAPARAWLAIDSLDDDRTAEAVETAEAALRSSMPWLGWVAGGPEEPDGLLPVAADLVQAPPDPPGTVTDDDAPWGPDLLLPFWRGVHAGPHRVRVALRYRAPAAPGAPGAAPTGSLTLSSASSAVLVHAGLLAAALSRGPGELTVAPHRSAAGILPLPASRVGRCLAAVCLLPDAWPSRPLCPPAEVVERLATTTPPHTVVFGGSGLGKTTLLEALVEHRLATGRTTVVIDPHGDLAARAAVSAQALGRPATSLDFGDAEQPPLWNLTQPPAGTDPRAWAADLLDAIQASWPDADQQWFGPVYRRAMHSLLLPLVLDPRGPWPLGRVHDLAAPMASGPARPGGASEQAAGADRWRRDVLARIDDPAVGRDLWEAVRMIDGDRESHARTWLLSKLEPLLRHPGMRRVVDTPVTSVDLDAVHAGRSLFVAAPASVLGDEGATVLSMLVLRRIWSGLRRLGPPPGGLDVVLDEAHRMPAALCRELLAEGRKYGLQLRLATQSPSLLAPQLRSALLTNAGTVATLRLGAEDAAHVRSRFPDLASEELGTLQPYRVAVTPVGGATSLGTGPRGRPLDDGGALRAAHRTELVRARGRALDRLRSDLDARLTALATPPAPARHPADGPRRPGLPVLPR